ncbi:hypothetical protein A2U01_0069196, partial [Trifolium medium]|nr:hypothetical protein [Trifolium medium]
TPVFAIDRNCTFSDMATLQMLLFDIHGAIGIYANDRNRRRQHFFRHGDTPNVAIIQTLSPFERS